MSDFFSRLYNIEKLHQTTTPLRAILDAAALYNIEKLHQTTTQIHCVLRVPGCIILKNYIKPQRIGVDHQVGAGCIILKNYIKPQHMLVAEMGRRSCIILKNYIKPQRRAYNRLISACLCGILADKTRPETSPKSIRCCFCISKNESNSFFRRIQVVGAFRAGPVRFCPKNS